MLGQAACGAEKSRFSPIVEEASDRELIPGKDNPLYKDRFNSFIKENSVPLVTVENKWANPLRMFVGVGIFTLSYGIFLHSIDNDNRTGLGTYLRNIVLPTAISGGLTAATIVAVGEGPCCSDAQYIEFAKKVAKDPVDPKYILKASDLQKNAKSYCIIAATLNRISHRNKGDISSLKRNIETKRDSFVENMVRTDLCAFSLAKKMTCLKREISE